MNSAFGCVPVLNLFIESVYLDLSTQDARSRVVFKDGSIVQGLRLSFMLILKTDFSVFIDFMMLEVFQIPFKFLLSEFS